MHNFFEKQMLWKERKSSKPVAIQKERLVNRHFSTNEFLYDLLTRLLLRLPELSYIFLALDSGIETNKYEDCQVTSVVSNSVRPHRRQPTRLRRPWDCPGKNTGVGCHFLLQCMKVKSVSEVAQSCLTLSDPMDCSLPGSSVHGIFQARVLEWGAITFSATPYIGSNICLCSLSHCWSYCFSCSWSNPNWFRSINWGAVFLGFRRSRLLTRVLETMLVIQNNGLACILLLLCDGS